ncbi:MAG: hypothetical protein R3F49_06365 [Planctomycetota bacterium]
MQTLRPVRTSVFLIFGALALRASATAQIAPCAEQARIAQTAGVLEAQADLQKALAIHQNILDPQERHDALVESFGEYLDELALVDEQYEGRLAVCSRLGGGVYAPDIDPQDFVAVIDNPFMPLLPGARRSYRKVEPNGVVETIEIEVLTETREILGVACTVVRDIAMENGVVIEETLDYYAQDTDGNVWYFGELAMNFEDGYLHDLDGSWIGGEDGAQPGILMQATPQVGTVYRQEFFLGEAEDTAGIVALGVQAQVPYGTFGGCLVTHDFSPVDPGLLEQKYYAPGIGVVLEINLVDGARLELMSVQ